jgi:MerR family transcriptional regulator, copper efflux regulator
MFIRELSQQTDVPAKTIRYYESIGLMPPPGRAPNNYHQYEGADVERLRFIASARGLGFSLADIGAILAARDQGVAPCERVLSTLDRRRMEIDRRLANMLALRQTLLALHQEGAELPLNDVDGTACVCNRIRTYRQSGEVAVQPTNPADESGVRP